MKYSNINIEDIDNYTLNEAKALYGENILPIWKEAVYAKPYKLESRRYIGCKAKLVDWIFDIIEKETQDISSFCDIFAGTGSVSNRAVQLYQNVIINDFLHSNHILYQAFFGEGDWNKDKMLNLLDAFNSIDPKKIKDNYFSENYGGKIL